MPRMNNDTKERSYFLGKLFSIIIYITIAIGTYLLLLFFNFSRYSAIVIIVLAYITIELLNREMEGNSQVEKMQQTLRNLEEIAGALEQKTK